MRHLRAVVVACFVVLAIAGAFVVATRDGDESVPLAETEIVFYAPWNASSDGLPSLTTSGSCSSGSNFTSRSDAWRCSTDASLLLDPCFSDPYYASEMVICAAGPGDPEGLRLTEPLPRGDSEENPPAGALYPWELVLEDGSRCYPLGGATVVMGDMRLNWACSPGGLDLYGDIDQSPRVWTIVALREGQSEGRRVRIAVART